jgi:hypothetical protein
MMPLMPRNFIPLSTPYVLYYINDLVEFPLYFLRSQSSLNSTNAHLQGLRVVHSLLYHKILELLLVRK